MKDETAHKDDWIRYQDFLQTVKESPETETWVHKRVFEKSQLYCRRFSVEDSLSHVMQWTLDVLTKQRYQKGRSLDSYLTRVIGEKAINVRKNALREEIVDSSPEVYTTVNQIFRSMCDERNYRRLLLEKPELSVKIIKLVEELDVRGSWTVEGDIEQPPPQELVEEMQEAVPDVSQANLHRVLSLINDHVISAYSFDPVWTVAATQLENPKHRVDLEGYLRKQVIRFSKFKDQERYDELYEKFERDEISQAEHDELLKLSDDREMLEARRLEYMSELAKVMGVTLDDVVEEFRSASDQPFHTFEGNINELRAT